MTGSGWLCLRLVARLTFSLHHAYLACSSLPLNRIVAHGILHLTGYQHQSDHRVQRSIIIINGVSTTSSRHIFPCTLNEQSPQLTSRLHMYGVCEAWRGVLPGTALTAHCGQVNRRTRYCHCHREVFTDILLDPYEENSPYNLLPVLWSRGGFPFILGLSYSLSASIFTYQEKLISCLCLFLLTLTFLNPTPKPDFCCCQVIFFTSIKSQILPFFY